VYRVVFDTNILLSAFIFGGNPEKLFELARAKKIQLLTSSSILAEFATRLKDKFLWDDADIAEAIKTIGYSSELIKPTQRLTVLDDDPDNRVLECALEGKADLVVSGDKHLLSLKEFEKIPVLKAADLVSKPPISPVDIVLQECGNLPEGTAIPTEKAAGVSRRNWGRVSRFTDILEFLNSAIIVVLVSRAEL
jgi:putative PIN family toxin of toxin-antitoxin system